MPSYLWLCDRCPAHRNYHSLTFAQAAKDVGEHPSDVTYRCKCGGVMRYQWGTPRVWISNYTEHGYNAVRDPLTDYTKNVLEPHEKQKRMSKKQRMAAMPDKWAIQRDKAAFETRKATGKSKVIVGAG